MKGIKQKGVPIATDDEVAIINATEMETELVTLDCYRGDIQRLVDENGWTKDDCEVYTNEIQQVLEQETKKDFQ